MNALTIHGGNADNLTMTSRELAEDFAPRVFKDIADMSKDELALILHGFVCKVMLIESQWKFRESCVSPVKYSNSECPSISRLLAALLDYETLSFFEDCRAQLDAAIAKKSGGGYVYVIEFSDGHIKIGYSITPESRIKALVGGNQASMTRSWIGAKINSPSIVESAAHKKFAEHRVGGEFFRVGFDDAVATICVLLLEHAA